VDTLHKEMQLSPQLPHTGRTHSGPAHMQSVEGIHWVRRYPGTQLVDTPVRVSLVCTVGGSNPAAAAVEEGCS
jgi:hypothetical protein